MSSISTSIKLTSNKLLLSSSSNNNDVKNSNKLVKTVAIWDICKFRTNKLTYNELGYKFFDNKTNNYEFFFNQKDNVFQVILCPRPKKSIQNTVPSSLWYNIDVSIVNFDHNQINNYNLEYMFKYFDSRPGSRVIIFVPNLIENNDQDISKNENLLLQKIEPYYLKEEEKIEKCESMISSFSKLLDDTKNQIKNLCQNYENEIKSLSIENDEKKILNCFDKFERNFKKIIDVQNIKSQFEKLVDFIEEKSFNFVYYFNDFKNMKNNFSKKENILNVVASLLVKQKLIEIKFNKIKEMRKEIESISEHDMLDPRYDDSDYDYY
jgi:hypothetical protein